MTKKQLLQALSIVEEDAEVTAIFQGKYSTRYPALVNGNRKNTIWEIDGVVYIMFLLTSKINSWL